MRVRYPRTPHVPWSPGATSDDVRLGGLEGFEGREVVITEKMDGENTTLYRDGLHARSLDSAHHPSRAWIKSFHGRVRELIPEGWRVSGENMFARHSIVYDRLDSWFYVFSVWDETDRCLDWEATVRFATELGAPVPRVLWRGVLDRRALKQIAAWKLDLTRQEGYVIRSVAAFSRAEFTQNVAKWVRRGHVQTDEHWMRGPVVENGRGPLSSLWDVRSGVHLSSDTLSEVAGFRREDGATRAEIVGAANHRLDVLGRRGDTRLAAVLAALLHDQPRALVLGMLGSTVGVPVARRAADMIGLFPKLSQYVPDEVRRNGLARMSCAVDIGALHAVAAAVKSEGSEELQWSELFAVESGLDGPAPFDAIRIPMQTQLKELDQPRADRICAEARELWIAGRIASAEQALAATYGLRAHAPPNALVTVGTSGSGKSHFVSTLDGYAVASLDAVREERGDRADQSDNATVLTAALDKLDALLSDRKDVVWDATCLDKRQRDLPFGVAHRRGALLSCAVFVVHPETVSARNAARSNPVPAGVLHAQLRRFSPPYPADAHRTLYLDESGAVADRTGGLFDAS